MTARALATSGVDLGEREVYIVAAGKGAAGMAAAAFEFLNRRIAGGVVTAPRPARDAPANVEFIESTHPLPGEASARAGRIALAVADDCRQRDASLLVCLSGGASAMLAVPAGDLTINDKAAATRAMLRAGVPIDELNLVRRHLSAIKGGRLAARAGRSLTLAISDVCVPRDDDPLVIGSGPTIADPTTAAAALAVLEHRAISREVPAAVIAHLQEASARGGDTEPAPPADTRPGEAHYRVVASRADAMRAAAAAAGRLGYAAAIRTAPITGDAKQAFASLLAEMPLPPRPCAVISSGETTVAVAGSGRGGRNQEFAAGALETLARLAPAGLASFGTDGRDGNSDAAGALVDHTIWPQLGAGARAICDDVFERNDTTPWLDRFGALLRTGPTGTNVGDVQILLLP